MLVEGLLSTARKRLVTIKDDAPLIDAAKLLRAGTDMVVVCNGSGCAVGVVTKTDVVGQISHCQGASCTCPASTVMTAAVVVCHPGDWVKDVWSDMKSKEFKNIPVLDAASQPIGLLTARDVLQVLLQESENEEELLRDYVMCVGYH
jgi:signal-transduction protein with cAMP-binding, CBS, and nucleotidyltransferase domain